MFCAQPITIKTCNSVDTTTSSSASTCGTYTKRDLIVLQANTTCTATQIQLTTANEFGLATASPWNLSIAEGGNIAVAILAVWALGWSFKALKKVLGDHSPE